MNVHSQFQIHSYVLFTEYKNVHVGLHDKYDEQYAQQCNNAILSRAFLRLKKTEK
jgi:hypothetical protein